MIRAWDKTCVVDVLQLCEEGQSFRQEKKSQSIYSNPTTTHDSVQAFVMLQASALRTNLARSYAKAQNNLQSQIPVCLYYKYVVSYQKKNQHIKGKKLSIIIK